MTRSLLAGCLAIVVAASAGSAFAHTVTPEPSEAATPMSQATTDDVAFALISVSDVSDSSLVIDVHAENLGDLPVSIEPGQITLTVTDSAGEPTDRALHRSTPALPCAIHPGQRLELSLTFERTSGDTAQSLSIGLTEVNRSGAMVIFPLQPGAGASAIGGSGFTGANAIGTPVSTPSIPKPNATPDASPEAGGCQI